MPDLDELLARASRVTDEIEVETDIGDVRARVTRRRRTRRGVRALGAVAVMALAAGTVTAALDDQATPADEGVDVETRPQPTGPGDVRSLDVPGTANVVLVVDDEVWIGGALEGRGYVGHLDAASGEMVDRFALEDVPAQMAIVDDAVWVISNGGDGDDDRLTMLSRQTGEVGITTARDSAADVVVHAGRAWLSETTVVSDLIAEPFTSTVQLEMDHPTVLLANGGLLHVWESGTASVVTIDGDGSAGPPISYGSGAPIAATGPDPYTVWWNEPGRVVEASVDPALHAEHCNSCLLGRRLLLPDQQDVATNVVEGDAGLFISGRESVVWYREAEAAAATDVLANVRPIAIAAVGDGVLVVDGETGDVVTWRPTAVRSAPVAQLEDGSEHVVARACHAELPFRFGWLPSNWTGDVVVDRPDGRVVRGVAGPAIRVRRSNVAEDPDSDRDTWVLLREANVVGQGRDTEVTFTLPGAGPCQRVHVGGVGLDRATIVRIAEGLLPVANAETSPGALRSLGYPHATEADYLEAIEESIVAGDLAGTVPAMVVGRFVEGVFGWRSSTVSTEWKGDGGAEVIVRDRQSGSEVHLTLRRLYGTGYLVVDAFSFGDQPWAVAYSLGGDDSHVVTNHPVRDTSAELVVRYGDTTTRTFSTEPGSWRGDLGLVPDAVGSIMVLGRDGAGRVVEGTGFSVPFRPNAG